MYPESPDPSKKGWFQSAAMVAGSGTPAGSWKVMELPAIEFDLGDSADHALNPGISGAEHDGTGGAKAVLHQ